MFKKLFSILAVLILATVTVTTTASASTVGTYAVPAPPGGASSMSYTETYYFSNATLGASGGGGLAIERLLKQKAGSAALGLAGAAATLAASVNQLSGKNGFKITVTYRYKLHRENYHSYPKYAWTAEKWVVGTY